MSRPKVKNSPLENLDGLLHCLVRRRWVRLQHGHSHVTLSHAADVLLLFLMYEKCHKINMVLLKLANIDEASTHGEITSLLMASLCFLRSLTTGSTPFSRISHIARQSESRPMFNSWDMSCNLCMWSLVSFEASGSLCHRKMMKLGERR